MLYVVLSANHLCAGSLLFKPSSNKSGSPISLGQPPYVKGYEKEGLQKVQCQVMHILQIGVRWDSGTPIAFTLNRRRKDLSRRQLFCFLANSDQMRGGRVARNANASSLGCIQNIFSEY